MEFQFLKHFGCCNNLDEVLNHIDEILQHDLFEFEGEEYEVTVMPLDYVKQAYVYNGKIVLVNSSVDGCFDVMAAHSFDFNKQYRCVLLPDYCRNELISILKGEN